MAIDMSLVKPGWALHLSTGGCLIVKRIENRPTKGPAPWFIVYNNMPGCYLTTTGLCPANGTRVVRMIPPKDDAHEEDLTHNQNLKRLVRTLDVLANMKEKVELTRVVRLQGTTKPYEINVIVTTEPVIDDVEILVSFTKD